MKHVFRYLVPVVLLVIAVGCGTSEKQKITPERASEVELREFKRAEATYRGHKTQQAIKELTTFIQRHPRNELTDSAMYMLGDLYYSQGDYFRASRYFRSVVDSPTLSGFYDRALLGAANSEAQMGHVDEALTVLGKLKIDEKTDRSIAVQVYDLSSKLKLQKGQNLSAVQDMVLASSLTANASERQILFSRAVDMVNGNLSQQDLSTLAGTPSMVQLELPARTRLGQMFYDQKNWSAAKDQFHAIIQKFPETAQAKHAQGVLNALDAQEKTDSTVVGVILPLSGKFADKGYKTLRGIQMGFGVYEKSSSTPIKLAIIDSEGNPDVARRGVERLVNEDHVVAIIGDILSKTAQAVAGKSQELGVPCVVLAQKQGLNEIGDFVFRNTVTPEMQVRALVDVAMNQRNMKKFAVVYPNDSYGTEYASLFWDYVLLKGGQITAAQSYEPEETDFRDVIQRLIGTFYAEEDRGKELALRTTEWTKDQEQQGKPVKQGRDKVPKDILPPIADFDAVFIPDGPKAVGQIAHMLNYNDVSKMPLLGTNLWDTPQFVQRGEKLVEGSLFVDDFFADDPSPAMKTFTNQFKTQFNYSPDIFEAQGFDSALLLSQILKSYDYSLTRNVLRDRLAAGSRAQGASGPIEMSASRQVEKLLVPLTISGGKIVKFETGNGAAQ